MNGELLEYSQWISEFKKTHGYAPRVLHIGNIANNAYNNAKLLNEIGFDCDVLCYDYYHTMGCPEWEDANFDGKIEDQFYPNWRSINLNGFKRPKWFVQGPKSRCIAYLIAKRSEKSFLALLHWVNLQRLRSNLFKHKGSVSRKSLRVIIKNIFAFSIFIVNFVRSDGTQQKKHLSNIWQGIKYKKQTIKSNGFSLFTVASCTLLFKYLILWVIYKSLRCIYILHISGTSNRQINNFITYSSTYSSDVVNRCDKLVSMFSKTFPDRDDRMILAELLDYTNEIKEWQRLFSYYDIIQAYSTDPLIPLLANVPYFAFEHGTLRDIPFENTFRGRTTALSYHLAEHVFVTNADCLANAHYLAGDKVSFINHPFDEDHSLKLGDGLDKRNKLLQMTDSEFLLFFPTRHDWVPGTGYADKANDIFLRAFCTLRKLGFRVGMTCCRWGANVAESLKLLQDQGCDKNVIWDDPMGTVNFELTAKASDIIVDQFKLGSFGGIMFKAMATGKPICTYLNEAEILSHYDEMPPVINCTCEEEIIEKIKSLIMNPAQLTDLGIKSRNWIKQYHASQKTTMTQANIYRQFLESNQLETELKYDQHK